MQAIDGFVSSKDGSMLEQAAPVTVKARNPSSELRRRWLSSQLKGGEAASALVIVEAMLQDQSKRSLPPRMKKGKVF